MTKEELIKWLISKGYKEDNYGHYQKIGFAGNKIRYKIQATSTRYERQVTFSDGKHEWVRILSAYYKDLSINEKGLLSGLKR